ncbi:OB-fold domain-containing protein [Candidatus Gottesmanbacteria bacterium]|nr:OB-fold domain-containing protein [Candidatus Gottesmanbacteria bacterium]
MSSPIKAWREQKKIAPYLRIKGKVVSWTIVRVPPHGFVSDAPYVVAIVETNTKKRLISQIVDVFDQKIKSGDQVESVYRRQKRPDEEGVIYYGLKFRLLYD